MTITNAAVLFNHKLSEDSCLIGLKAPQVAEKAQPGQFVMLRMQDELWRHRLSRPFSLCRVENDIVEIYFRIVGSGTRMLSGCSQGDTMELLGPLGNGFTISPRSELNIMVAGGMGVAPFPFLALRLSQLCQKAKNVLFTGAKTKDHLHHLDYFEEIGVQIRLATDDGSAGYKGFVTELFEQELDEIVRGRSEVKIFACGPQPLLKKTAEIAIEHDIACQVAMEERMACGTGACLACVCKTGESNRWKYSRVCKEGPIFDAKEIIFD